VGEKRWESAAFKITEYRGISKIRLTLFSITFYMVDLMYGKNGFVTATKFGTINTIFVAATKNFAASAKRFVDRTKHFVVVTKYFCYPYFNK